MYDNTPADTSPAIPTMYRGIRMRSRLEAKWAYMFDSFAWSWEYEPLDLNGWIPDFLIRTAGRPLLVDVKPAIGRDLETEAKIEAALGKDLGTKFQALITAVAPWDSTCWQSASLIGWGAGGAHWECETWDDMVITCYGGIYGFASECGDYTDRITGFNDGGHMLTATSQDIRNRWNMATNFAQWRAPRVRG